MSDVSSRYVGAHKTAFAYRDDAYLRLICYQDYFACCSGDKMSASR